MKVKSLVKIMYLKPMIILGIPYCKSYRILPLNMAIFDEFYSNFSRINKIRGIVNTCVIFHTYPTSIFLEK